MSPAVCFALSVVGWPVMRGLSLPVLLLVWANGHLMGRGVLTGVFGACVLSCGLLGVCVLTFSGGMA